MLARGEDHHGCRVPFAGPKDGLASASDVVEAGCAIGRLATLLHRGSTGTGSQLCLGAWLDEDFVWGQGPGGQGVLVGSLN